MSDCIFCHPEKLNFIWDNGYCMAVVPLDQYARGHLLIVLKQHRDDITDTFLKAEELYTFIRVIREQAREMKRLLGAEMIYVCILCDGVHHLHAHLIPRYKGDKMGFQFLAEQEKKFDAIRFPEKSDK